VSLSITESERLICIGLLVGAPEYGVKGTSLWQNNNCKKWILIGFQLCLTPTLIASFQNIVFGILGNFYFSG
jgi:hypothetical protein